MKDLCQKWKVKTDFFEAPGLRHCNSTGCRISTSAFFSQVCEAGLAPFWAGRVHCV